MPVSFPILLVDDDPNIADVLTRAARHSFPEAHIIPTYSFAGAVDYLEGLKGFGPRLVLLDIDLQSEQTGLDFLRLWKAHSQGRLIPVVILTANQSLVQQRQAYQLGANAYMIKPYSYPGWKELAQLLRTFWFGVVTIPRLWFEAQGTENESV